LLKLNEVSAERLKTELLVHQYAWPFYLTMEVLQELKLLHTAPLSCQLIE